MSGMSEMFWMFLITSSTTFLFAVIKMCYKSKCSEVSVCCLKIRRDVNVEEKEMEFIETQREQHKDDSDEESKI